MERFVPVTTDLNLRLKAQPYYLPLDKEYSLTLTTLRSAFGSQSIGLKYLESDITKIVPCKGTKLYPPKKAICASVQFVVIKESTIPETNSCFGFQTTDNSVRQTRYSITKPSTFQSQTNNNTSQSSSSSPNKTFPELNFQVLDDLDLEPPCVTSCQLVPIKETHHGGYL